MNTGCWDDYIKLVHWIFINRNVKFTDDDSQNCYLVFLSCKKNHNALKSSFSNYLTHSINNYVKNKKSKKYRKSVKESSYPEAIVYIDESKCDYREIMFLILRSIANRKDKKYLKVFYRRNVLCQPISYINKLYGLDSRTTYKRLKSAKASLCNILHTNGLDKSLLDD